MRKVTFPSPPPPPSLTESPFKVVMEQVSGTEPEAEQEDEEEEMEGEESASSLAVLQRPLEICLKHSTVSTPEGTACPLVQPQLGVSALHEYARWISKLQQKADGDGEGETYSQMLLMLETGR